MQEMLRTADTRGLNCAAKPAPPRVVVSRWPEKRAALWGRGLRADVEEPPRTASLVGIQGGGVKGLIGNGGVRGFFYHTDVKQ